jgi:hypothetical protein
VNVTLPAGAATGPASAPTVAVHPRSNDVLLAWLAEDGAGWRVWFARSRDAGATWSTPVGVSPPGERVDAVADSPPRIACDATDRVALTWASAGEMSGASRIRFARSLDGGRAWTPPVSLDDAPGPILQGQHDFVSSDEGRLVVAWLDSRPGGDGASADTTSGTHRSVRIARSGDFGGSWSAAEPLWSHACPGCGVAVGLSTVQLETMAFRRLEPPDLRDIVVARPPRSPVRVFPDFWATHDCPGSGPSLTVARDGTHRVAWTTGAPGRAGVWFRQGILESYDSTVTPILLLAGERSPTVRVATGDAGRAGTLVACDADSMGPGGLLLARVAASGRQVAERLAVPGVRGASRPSVAASNTSRRAYVAWTEAGDGRPRVRMLRWEVGR